MSQTFINLNLSVMKKYYFIFISIIIALYIYSCHKDEINDEILNPDSPRECSNNSYSTKLSNSEEIDAYLTIYYEKHKYDRIEFQNRWKWMKVRVGTHLFNNCTGNNPCGPCPGICFKLNEDSSEVFNIVNDDYTLTRGEYNDGGRLMQGALLNDTIMALTFIHTDFTFNDVLYIPKDFEIGSSAANSFAKHKIIVLEGEYPVSYTHSRNGTTLVRVKIQ